MSASQETSEVAGTMVSARHKKTPDLHHMPGFGKVGYLSATEGEIVLKKAKGGLFKITVTDEVAAHFTRDELEQVELEERRGFARLRLKWKGARWWEFDIAGSHRKTARAFVETLGGTISGLEAGEPSEPPTEPPDPD